MVQLERVQDILLFILAVHTFQIANTYYSCKLANHLPYLEPDGRQARPRATTLRYRTNLRDRRQLSNGNRTWSISVDSGIHNVMLASKVL